MKMRCKPRIPTEGETLTLETKVKIPAPKNMADFLRGLMEVSKEPLKTPKKNVEKQSG